MFELFILCHAAMDPFGLQLNISQKIQSLTMIQLTSGFLFLFCFLLPFQKWVP